MPFPRTPGPCPPRCAVYSSSQAVHTGRPCSQGGVKVPTGGKGGDAQARERLLPIDLLGGRVSRFGATPKPTVTVRMKENGLRRFARLCRVGTDVPGALILVLKEKSHESDLA